MPSKSDTDHPPAGLVFLWCLSGALGFWLAWRATGDWAETAFVGVILMLILAMLLVIPVALAWSLAEWVIEVGRAARDRTTRSRG